MGGVGSEEYLRWVAGWRCEFILLSILNLGTFIYKGTVGPISVGATGWGWRWGDVRGLGCGLGMWSNFLLHHQKGMVIYKGVHSLGAIQNLINSFLKNLVPVFVITWFIPPAPSIPPVSIEREQRLEAPACGPAARRLNPAQPAVALAWGQFCSVEVPWSPSLWVCLGRRTLPYTLYWNLFW